MKYRKNQQVALFDKENTLQDLLEKGNPLPALKEIIDFEQFRDLLEPVFEKQNRKSNAGRRPIDPVFMFRMLFLQRQYGLGDAQVEYLINPNRSLDQPVRDSCHKDVSLYQSIVLSASCRHPVLDVARYTFGRDATNLLETSVALA